MKPKSILSFLITVFIVGYAVYDSVPRYHNFMTEEDTLEPGNYHYASFTSKSSSPIGIEVWSTGDELFDAYLFSEDSMKVLTAWMESDSEERPKFEPIWHQEGVSSINAKDIAIGVGEFYIVIDNTLLGTAASKEAFAFSYQLSEKY